MDLGENRNSAYRNGQIPGPDIFGGAATNSIFPDNLVNTLDPQSLQAQFPGLRDISQVNQVLNAAGFNEATEYVELANARKLNPNEFTFHPQ